MIEFNQYDYLETETKVTVIADSTSPITSARAVTFLCRVPRFILPELNTHRVFSRNVSSSRAKRFSSLIKDTVFHPKLWIENHKGMQGAELLPTWKGWFADFLWSSSKWSAVVHGYLLDKLGVSKQYTNRAIEPYCYIDYLVTSTEWNNFLVQRDDNAAQFEIQVLARKIKEALKKNQSVLLKYGEWHLPFITAWEKEQFDINTQIKLSVARCARTSYTDLAYRGYSKQKSGKHKLNSGDKDMILYHQLVLSKPPHLSPTEHQLLAENPTANLEGNTKGFVQYRKLLEFYQFEQERVEQYVEKIT